MVATDVLAFGGPVPPAYVEFVDDMLGDAVRGGGGVLPELPRPRQVRRRRGAGKVPTTVVCGTADRLTSIGHSRSLHSRISGSRLLEVQGSGHMVMIESPDEVNGGLAELVRRGGGAMSALLIAPTVHRVGPEAAAEVLAVVREAFAARPPLDPPADALAETEASIAAAARQARRPGRPAGERTVGALVLDPIGGTMYLRRFGVLPDRPGARGGRPADRRGRLGLRRVRRPHRRRARGACRGPCASGSARASARSGGTPRTSSLRRPLRTFVFDAPDAEAMREIGGALAARLEAGDLLVLSGELGAGKTTFTQGIGAGLQVRGAVTSPTFVIARVHPSLVDGPALVHVDAYRLGGIDEPDDLDLDTSLEDAVTVVEWGEGWPRGSPSRGWRSAIIRALADDDPDAEVDSEPGPAPGADDAGRTALVRARRTLQPPAAAGREAQREPAARLPPLRGGRAGAPRPEIPLVLCADRGRARGPDSARAQLLESASGACRARTRRRASGRCREGPPYAPIGRRPARMPPELEFVGVATVQLGHERRIEYAAIFHGTVEHPLAFAAERGRQAAGVVGPGVRSRRARRSTPTWRGSRTGFRRLDLLLLAFDTATPLVTVALHDGADVVVELTSERPMKHGEQLRAADRAGARAGGDRPPGPHRGGRRRRPGTVHRPAGRAGHRAHARAFVLEVPVYGVCSLDVLAVEAAAGAGHRLRGRHRRASQGGLPRVVRRLGRAARRPGGREAGGRRDRPAGRGGGRTLYPTRSRTRIGPVRPSAGWLARAVAEELAEIVRPRAALPAPSRRRDAAPAQEGVVTVRRGDLADIEDVAALEQENLGVDAWSPHLVAEGIAGNLPTVFYLVAEVDGAVVGYAVASAVADIAELQRIAVTPAHRRGGLGLGAAGRGLPTGLESGADRLLLEVRENNAGALRFYAARDFVEIDRRPRYYRDGTTAIVLRLPLVSGCGRGWLRCERRSLGTASVGRRVSVGRLRPGSPGFSDEAPRASSPEHLTPPRGAPA